MTLKANLDSRAVGGGPYGQSMPTSISDGEAVAACRALLKARGVGGHANWRNTIVGTDGAGWVVRIWVSVPVEQSRPAGTPDYVFRASPATDGEDAFTIEEVHSLG